MSTHAYCDGIRRRDLLHLGAAGLSGFGLTLPGLLAAEQAQRDQHANARDGMSLIIVFLQGGLSTIDTWDMKPDAPAGVSGGI